MKIYAVTFFYQNYEGKREGISYENYGSKEAMKKDIEKFITYSGKPPKNVDIYTAKRKAISKRFNIPVMNIFWSIYDIEIVEKNVENCILFEEEKKCITSVDVSNQEENEVFHEVKNDVFRLAENENYTEEEPYTNHNMFATYLWLILLWFIVAFYCMVYVASRLRIPLDIFLRAIFSCM